MGLFQKSENFQICVTSFKNEFNFADLHGNHACIAKVGHTYTLIKDPEKKSLR